MNISSDRQKYSPASSRNMMQSRKESTGADSSTDTARYIRRSDTKPAPPPYTHPAIPRVKPIRHQQKESNNSVGERSRPTSRRFDTFGENALETIYDQFKFLDESDEPSQTPTSSSSIRPIMTMPTKKHREERSRTMILYCILPTLEMLAAIAILVTSFIRSRKSFENIDNVVEPLQNDDSITANKAIHELAFQNAISTVVPAVFQIISSIFGFWPIFSSKNRKAAQILHMVFNSIVIVLWFNAIYELFFKISMEHLLEPNTANINSDEKYIIDLIVACITYFATVILPAITLSIASFNLMYPHLRSNHKSMSAITISLGALLFSLATSVIAIFTAQANINGPRDVTDNSSLYVYGLKESIIFIFVVINSIFSLIVATQNNRPLMLAAVAGQGISLMAVTSELFSYERVSSIVNELQNITTRTTSEIGIILLNGCEIASCALLVLQLSIFIFSISQPSLGSTHSLLIDDNNRNPPSRVERTAF